MRDPRWRRIVQVFVVALWWICWVGWAIVLPGGHVTGGLVGVLVGSGAAWGSRWRMSNQADQSYEALSQEQRALVDGALAAGELRGPIALRQVERDVARTRLSRSGSSPTSRAVWWSLAVALFIVALVLAPSHPLWLVVASVLALAGAALLAFALPSAQDLDPDERRRLKTVSKTPLGY